MKARPPVPSAPRGRGSQPTWSLGLFRLLRGVVASHAMPAIVRHPVRKGLTPPASCRVHGAVRGGPLTAGLLLGPPSWTAGRPARRRPFCAWHSRRFPPPDSLVGIAVDWNVGQGRRLLEPGSSTSAAGPGGHPRLQGLTLPAVGVLRRAPLFDVGKVSGVVAYEGRDLVGVLVAEMPRGLRSVQQRLRRERARSVFSETCRCAVPGTTVRPGRPLPQWPLPRSLREHPHPHVFGRGLQ